MVVIESIRICDHITSLNELRAIASLLKRVRHLAGKLSRFIAFLSRQRLTAGEAFIYCEYSLSLCASLVFKYRKSNILESFFINALTWWYLI